MLSESKLEILKQIAFAIAKEFGGDCEILVHNINNKNKTSEIAVIENGHVSSRSLGDGPSHAVLEAMRSPVCELEDKFGYLTRTHDGRVLKSTTIYLKNADGELDGIFSMNHDITVLLSAKTAIESLVEIEDKVKNAPQPYIPRNVNDLLDELIEESVKLVGKPVAMMTKDDKVDAIRFLSEHGALLITKSSDKISKYFNISKYTLYNYIDQI